jgi:DNA-binding phage protein
LKISIILAALTGTFETDMSRASKTAQKRMREIEKTAKEVGRVLGTALVAGATAAALALKSAIDRADELSKAAQKIGISTEALSALSYAAELADVELSELQAGLARLTKFQSEAAKGTEQNIALFEALGISFRNVDGTLRNTEEVFRDFADVFQALPDGASKTALALDVFGRSGANLIPLMNGGAASLDRLEEEARTLGILLNDQTGKAAEEFNDNLTRLQKVVGGVALQVAADLLPDLIRLTEQFIDTSTEGDNVATTAHDIADAFRATAEFGIKVFNVLKAMTLGAVGFYSKVGELQQKFTAFRFMPGAGDAAQTFADVSAVSFAGAEEAIARVMNGPGAAAAPGFTRTVSRKGEEADTRGLTDALNEYYGSRQNAASADKAAAEAARLAAEAQRELERILEAGNEARAGLTETVEQNAAEMAGPAAQAAREYADEMVRLVGEQDKLAAANLLTADAERELALAREQSFEAYQRQLDEIEKQRTEVYDNLIADMKFELDLLGMTNLEREKAIALRYANVDAASAEGQAIAGMLEEIDRAQRVAEGMDVVRDATQGLFEDLMSGAKSASEAFTDFVDSILEGIAQIVARNLTENLLGSFGSAGGGQAGGWLSSLFGSFFGGARAGGGPVMSGVPYLVGEQGPELVIPSSSGTVIPAGKTAAMLGGGTVINNFSMPGRYDLRTQAQVAADAGRSTQRALARGTA